MTSKINVNGVAYDSVETMPPDVRRLYEQAMSEVPELADRDGDGVMVIAQSGGGPFQMRTVVRKKFVVNGTTYEDEAAMPPDVRRIVDEAMHKAMASNPTVKKSEIKFSFNLTGPGFNVHKTAGTSTEAGREPSLGVPTVAPIEPSSGAGGLRVAFVLAACAAVGLVLWFLTRGH